MFRSANLTVLAGAILVTVWVNNATAQTAVLSYEVVDFNAVTGRESTSGRALIDSGLTLLSGTPTSESLARSLLYFNGEIEEIEGFSPAGIRPMNSLGQMIGWATFGPGLSDIAVYDSGTITRYELPDDELQDSRELLILQGFNSKQHAITLGGRTGIESYYFLGDDRTVCIGTGWCDHDCDFHAEDFPIGFTDNNIALFYNEDPFNGRRGWIYDGNTGEKTFLWPHNVGPEAETYPVDINDAGKVIGDLAIWDPDDGEGGAFIWQDGEFTLIKDLIDEEWSFLRPIAINNLDQILLWGRETPGPPSRLYLFDDGDLSLVPLEDLLPDVTNLDIIDFNARGEILINGRVDDINHGFLLVPITIPEPASLTTLTLTVLLLRRRRPH